jgi:hypothetical protein
MPGHEFDALRELISEQLEAVTFIRDYLQLQFGAPPLLNVYTTVTVSDGTTVCRSNEADFARAVVAQLNKRVHDVRAHSSKYLEILFEDRSSITVSLRAEDYRGPEAFTYFGKDGTVTVA